MSDYTPNRDIPPPGPENYRDAYTCAVCFEPFGNSLLGDRFDRWHHRRRWGHNPEHLRSRQAAADQHEQNVQRATEYRERSQ